MKFPVLLQYSIIFRHLLIFLIVFSSAALQGKDIKHHYKNVKLNQIDFSEVTVTIDKKSADTLGVEGMLKHKTMVEGIPCISKIAFGRNWTLKSAKLADKHQFGEHIFPMHSIINLQVNINPLKRYFAIRGCHVYVVNTCKFPCEQLINGIHCTSDEEVIFRPDWTLLACILSEECTIGKNTIEAGTFIRFDDSAICCYCLNDPVIQGYHCAGDNYKRAFWAGSTGILLYQSGKLKYFQPYEDMEVKGVWCKRSPARGGISLYENGKLKQCISARDQSIDGVQCEKNFTLLFDKNGKLLKAEKERIF